jgi:hypothetical protein
MKLAPSVSLQAVMQLNVALTVDTSVMFAYVFNGDFVWWENAKKFDSSSE